MRSSWSSDVGSSDRKAVGDQLHRVAPALSRVVGVLAHAARDMHQVAVLGFAAALDQLAEQRHLVPMGVRHPLAILLAVVVGGDVHLRHLVEIGKHTSELQSLMRNSSAVFCLKKKKKTPTTSDHTLYKD